MSLQRLRRMHSRRQPPATNFDHIRPVTGPQRIKRRMNGLASVLPMLNPIRVEITSRIWRYKNTSSDILSAPFCFTGSPSGIYRDFYFAFLTAFQARDGPSDLRHAAG